MLFLSVTVFFSHLHQKKEVRTFYQIFPGDKAMGHALLPIQGAIIQKMESSPFLSAWIQSKMSILQTANDSLCGGL